MILYSFCKQLSVFAEKSNIKVKEAGKTSMLYSDYCILTTLFGRERNKQHREPKQTTRLKKLWKERKKERNMMVNNW